MSRHYFISDAHLGAASARAEERLAGFLAGLEGRADTLWVVGDLFDFWFEYGRAVPKHGFRVLAALARLRATGTAVTILAGNHDPHFGGFFRRELGIATGTEARVVLDGRRVLMRHGDEADRRLVSRLFRVLMRSRANNALYRLIHPDLGIGFAGRVSGRFRGRVPDAGLAERTRRYARACLAQDNDIVVFGHLHRPELKRFPEGCYLNTGDWLHNSSYGIMRDGELALEHYDR